MAWLKFTNAFTGYPVHIRGEQVAAVTRTGEAETLVELASGGKVTVRETVAEVLEAVEPKPAAKKREIETR